MPSKSQNDWGAKYYQGWSLRKIAAGAGRSRDFVRKRLAKESFEIRPRGDRPGQFSSHWRGGIGTIAVDGSLVIRRGGKTLRLARLIVESIIGRALRPKEVVHHENGKPTDNRPENLRVFNNQGEHNAYHAAKRKKKIGN